MNITYSNWNAQNIPAGLTFDSANGIFSGTPSVNEGEYVVPVSVQTNYGSDSKNVKVVVEGGYHGVYALGSQAAKWSNNAEPDAYGFRKLNIPNANRLSTLAAGFAAKCEGGKWFISSSKKVDIYGGDAKSSSTDYSLPAEFPVDGVLDITGGQANTGLFYFAYKTNDKTYLSRYTKSGGSFGANFVNYERDDIILLPKSFSTGWVMVRNDNFVLYDLKKNNIDNGFTPDENIVKYAYIFNAGTTTGFIAVYYITESGKLWEWSNAASNGQGTPQDSFQLMPEREDFVDLWCPSGNSFFALTADKKLYVKGANTTCQLGIPSPAVINNLTFIGEFDVKKIEPFFMLTRDGKLYHSDSNATSADVSIAGEAHSQWTHIFPEYRFIDISYNLYSPSSALGTQTLVAILDD